LYSNVYQSITQNNWNVKRTLGNRILLAGQFWETDIRSAI
jgi:hypothetical protein